VNQARLFAKLRGAQAGRFLKHLKLTDQALF
jgi:hypothetical protein